MQILHSDRMEHRTFPPRRTFGCMAGGAVSLRLDMLMLLSTNHIMNIGAMAILGDDPTLGQANTVTINYQARTGFTFKLNGLENIPSTVQDVTTPRNSRTQNFGILANMNGSSVDSYAYMLKINYFRISNVTR